MAANQTMEEQVQKIEKYKKIICRNLVASDILSNLVRVDTIDQGVCAEIFETELANPVEAATILVDNLVKSKQLGWYQIFLEALNEKRFEIIVKTLEDGLEAIRYQKTLEELLHIYYSRLCDNINATELLPILLQRECLIPEDAERVVAADNLKGRSYATLCLLINIAKKSEAWFQGLMFALTHTGHQDIVDEIEPKLRVAAQKSYKETGEVLHRLVELNEETTKDPQHHLEQSEAKVLNTGVPRNDSAYSTKTTSKGTKSKTSSSTSYHQKGSSSKIPPKRACTYSDVGSSSSQGSSFHPSHYPVNPEFKPSADVDQIVQPLSLNLNVENCPPGGPSSHSLASDTSDSVHDLSHQSAASKLSGKGSERAYQMSHKSDPAVDLEAPNVCDPADSASMKCASHMVLRDYQQELLTPALQGQNAIIYAPHGAGMSYTAVALAKHILLKSASKKVLHLVPSTDHITKAVALYEKHLEDHECQAIVKPPVNRLLMTSDVFVTTVEVLFQMLKDSELITLADFSLMIMNLSKPLMDHLQVVMTHYFEEKLNGSSVPQILAFIHRLDVLNLDAALDEDAAKKNILQLCSQFDSCICQVEKHKRDLKKHVKVTDKEFHSVNGREQDPFCILVTSLMIQVEKMIRKENAGGKEVAEIKDQLRHLPSHKGCSEYGDWLKSRKKPVAKIPDKEVRTVYEGLMFSLRIYNEALVINQDCQTSHAIEFIERKLKEHCQYDVDKRLLQIFKEKKPEMIEISKERKYANPKLRCLKTILQDYHHREQTRLKAVLFCKGMETAECLEKWVSVQSLEGLKVTTAAFLEEGKDENYILKYFRVDKAGLVITDGKYEQYLKGLNDCNCVIHYALEEHNPTTITVKGRAANDCNKDVCIRGLQLVCSLSEDEFRKQRDEYQGQFLQHLKGKERQDFTDAGVIERRLDNANSVKLSCNEDTCRELACYSSELRKKNGVVVVISEQFKSKVNIEPQSPKSIKGERNLENVGVLRCKKCGKGIWGVLLTDKSTGERFYAPSVSSFILEYPDGRKCEYRRWTAVKDFDIPDE